MAFKVGIAFALLVAANASELTYSSPVLAFQSPLTYAASPLTYAGSAIGSTQQNVVRSFGGTVSQYSKAVDTPFSSVRKVDTRINNNVYTPALARTLTYGTPIPAVSAHAAPVIAGRSIAYSPAATVAQVSFDGLGAHYVY